jgi:hypothetical protein
MTQSGALVVPEQEGQTMSQQRQDPNLARQKRQDARAVKDAPLIKAAAAKARQESRDCLAGSERQRRGTDSLAAPEESNDG